MAHYLNGTAATEQDLIDDLDSFLVNNVGWTLIDTVTDTGSDNDRVYFRQGTNGLRDMYVRWRGTGNQIRVYGYSLWVSSGQNSDEIHNSSNTVINVGSSSLNYWFFGDAHWCWVIVQNGDNSNYYSCFGGFCNSYYNSSDDDLPLAVAGMGSNTYTFESDRLYMYSPVISGTPIKYESLDAVSSSLLVYSSPNTRDGSFGFLPIITYTDITGHFEVRGELPGIFQANGAGLSTQSFITISGTTEQVFIVKHSSNTNTYGFGPIPV
jgi:hypothetical protein